MRKGLGFIGVLAFGLLVGGCATTNWEKGGASQAQGVKDVNECANKAQLPVVEGNAPVAGAVVPYSYEQEKIFNKCMTDKGYKAKM
ncbi:MAG: hypothetical protein AABZ64_06040 [Nitrospinota bacterium]